MEDENSKNEKEKESKLINRRYSMDIDCASGGIRPDTYAKYIKDTFNFVEFNVDKDIVGAFFGNWAWEFTHASEKDLLNDIESYHKKISGK